MHAACLHMRHKTNNSKFFLEFVLIKTRIRHTEKQLKRCQILKWNFTPAVKILYRTLLIIVWELDQTKQTTHLLYRSEREIAVETSKNLSDNASKLRWCEWNAIVKIFFGCFHAKQLLAFSSGQKIKKNSGHKIRFSSFKINYFFRPSFLVFNKFSSSFFFHNGSYFHVCLNEMCDVAHLKFIQFTRIHHIHT